MAHFLDMGDDTPVGVSDDTEIRSVMASRRDSLARQQRDIDAAAAAASRVRFLRDAYAVDEVLVELRRDYPQVADYIAAIDVAVPEMIIEYGSVIERMSVTAAAGAAAPVATKPAATATAPVATKPLPPTTPASTPEPTPRPTYALTDAKLDALEEINQLRGELQRRIAELEKRILAASI